MNETSLQEFGGLSLKDRIALVWEDLQFGRDCYRNFHPHDLAELVGVPNADVPGPDGMWTFTKFARRIPLAEYLETSDTDSAILRPLLDTSQAPRSLEILEIADQFEETGVLDIERLTPQEVRLIEDGIMQSEMKEFACGNVIARTSVPVAVVSGASGDHNLTFEAFIEDDGACIELKTPYDVIPALIDQYPCAQSRLPIDIIRQG